MKKYAYLILIIPFLLPLLSIYCATLTGLPNLSAYFIVFIIFLLLPLIDFIIGKDSYNPNEQERKQLEKQLYYRLLTLLCVPLLIIVVFCSAAYFANGPLNMIGKIGWILSIGILTGGIGIVAAHELIHKDTHYERAAGGILLALVCYATFKVEHIRGHHVWVATDRDISTAKYHQSLYSFLKQTLYHNFLNGWALEAAWLRQKKQAVISLHNELIGWYALTGLFILILYAGFGIQAVLFFIGQSIIAIILLETINYIEHYGLSRKKFNDGHYAYFGIEHAWNSSYLISNLLLFQLQRHSDHHLASKRRYQALLLDYRSPTLPAGYPSMILLAMVPPLWFRIMHPLIASINNAIPTTKA